MKNSKHAYSPESFTPNNASKINYSLANVYLASKSTTEALMLAARKPFPVHTMPSMEVLYFEYASVLEHEWHRRSPGRTGQPRRSPALPLGRLARPTFALNFRSALWSLAGCQPSILSLRFEHLRRFALRQLEPFSLFLASSEPIWISRHLTHSGRPSRERYGKQMVSVGMRKRRSKWKPSFGAKEEMVMRGLAAATVKLTAKSDRSLSKVFFHTSFSPVALLTFEHLLCFGFLSYCYTATSVWARGKDLRAKVKNS